MKEPLWFCNDYKGLVRAKLEDSVNRIFKHGEIFSLLKKGGSHRQLEDCY